MKAPRYPDGKFVYIVIANDFPPFKVGGTTDLNVRSKQLKWVMPGGMRLWRWWAPHDVWTYGPHALRSSEVDVQARLHAWAAGGEWFHGAPEAYALIGSWGSTLPPPAECPLEESRFKQRRRWLAAHYAEAA